MKTLNDSLLVSPSQVSAEDIARRAYQLWEHQGCPEGRHEEHWLAAERELNSATAFARNQESTPPAAVSEAGHQADETAGLKPVRERKSPGRRAA